MRTFIVPSYSPRDTTAEVSLCLSAEGTSLGRLTAESGLGLLTIERVNYRMGESLVISHGNGAREDSRTVACNYNIHHLLVFITRIPPLDVMMTVTGEVN